MLYYFDYKLKSLSLNYTVDIDQFLTDLKMKSNLKQNK